MENVKKWVESCQIDGTKTELERNVRGQILYKILTKRPPKYHKPCKICKQNTSKMTKHTAEMSSLREL